MKRIIQLVPGLAPMLNGVGDYSLVLARTLRDRFGVMTHFAVCNAGWRGPAEVEGFAVAAVRTGDARLAASELDRMSCRGSPQLMLLQFSPYGFDPCGAPSWLVQALLDWRRASAGRSIVTYFHELFAMGAPWRKSFWLSPLQRHASARVARLSDHLVTNRARAAQWLARAAGIPATLIEVLPVLSNVGERECGAVNRAARLIVWGGGPAKSRLYRRHGELLAGVAGKLGIESVVDIGSACPDLPRAIGPAAVTGIGVAAAERIAELLGTSSLGVLVYPPTMLGKSSIFAAFAANALPALALDADDAPRALPEGLARGTHLLTREDAAHVSLASLPSIGGAARDWYAGHDAYRHAAHIAKLLASQPPNA